MATQAARTCRCRGAIEIRSMSPELTLAEKVARAAGQAALRYYGSVVAEYKAGNSPVTAADHAANECIAQALSEAFPADAILSEESRDTSARLHADRVWIVDPLDGTKEFLSQNGEFSIMIGLVVAQEPVLGVVYLPAHDVLFSAEKGEGSWVERDGRRERLACEHVSNGSLRMVGSRSHPDPLLTRMQEALGITDVEPSGSVGIKCSLIAERKRDLYIHPVPYLKEWDTCAPEIVLREAGGVVTDCTGEPLKYNKPDPVQPHGILACAPGAFARVFSVIAPLYAARQPKQLA